MKKTDLKGDGRSNEPDVLSHDEVNGLIAEGREQGYLQAGHIRETLRDVELTAEQMDDFFVLLHDLGVDVLEADEAASDEAPAVETPEADTESSNLKKLDLSVKTATSDPVRMYLREILKISQEPVSLETPIGEEEDSQLGDFIEDEDATMPVEAVSEIMQKEELNMVLGTLTHRERKVIELRFGLKGEHPRTLEEVGQKFGVTRERIRQIEAKTLAKLKAYRDSQRLRDFLD